MAKHSATAERRDAFFGQAGPNNEFTASRSGGFACRLCAPADRYTLRMPAEEAASLGALASFDVSQGINEMRETIVSDGAQRISARLGPDEWLLIAPHTDGTGRDAGAAKNLMGELSTVGASVVDISHRNIGFEVTGRGVRDVLNTGCPLDLDDDAFPATMATRTLFSKAEIVLLRGSDRTPGEPLYRIEGWRSYARYLYGHLSDSAQLLGF